jgi:hypothetical protein
VAEAIVAIIGWREAAALKENRRFVQRAEAAGKVTPRGWHRAAARFRSLTLRADGSCELQSFTAATAARRAGGAVSGRTSGKARNGERG